MFLLGVALVLAIVVKALFLQAFYIPSESMEPGLVANDRILVEKPSYWFDGSPERGDVIVFRDPGDWLSIEDSGATGRLASLLSRLGLYPSGGHLVKRVIGVAGDVIRCCDGQGRLRVNGTPLDEGAYLQRGDTPCNGPAPQTCSWTAGPVPAGNLFVMGDNRGHSADSSYHLCVNPQITCVPGDEFVATDLVVGKVFVLLWPRDRFSWLHRPASFADVPAGPHSSGEPAADKMVAHVGRPQ